MKSLLILLVSGLMTLSVFAQTTNTVTININGNRNRQIVVDGKAYTVNTTSTTSTTAKNSITINDLLPGQHTLQVIRANANNNRTTSNTTTFNLRTRYDLLITVNGDGSVQLKESRNRNRSNTSQYKTAMSESDFAVLMEEVRDIQRQNTRVTVINSYFTNTDNYFTTTQAKQLIQFVNSQPSRLLLAKASYRSITDPANFTLLNDLLTTQARRNELAAYVTKYNLDNPVNNTGTVYKTPMSATDFNRIYQDVQNTWSASGKMTALTNIFANTSYYFTTAQSRQLIQLITGESSRLQLAKSAYARITDPANFSQLYDLLSSQASRNELAVYVNSYNSGNAGNVNNNPYKTPMSDANFNAIYSDVQNTWGLGAKFSQLTNIFANTSYYFTTAQSKQLIQLVSSESNRLQLAKSAYARITDLTNFSQLYDVLSSQASRDELTVYVNSQNGNTTGSVNNNQYRVAMTDANFTALLNKAKGQWIPGAKMTVLTDAFANTNNYFTVAQARQLIQQTSTESNRLRLAKSAYRNIVDPINFNQIYDLFTSQASRDELAAYVDSYAYSN